MKKAIITGLFTFITLFLHTFPLHALMGDMDGSGAVDGDDLAIFSETFGAKSGSSQWNVEADFVGNGFVDGEDLSFLAPNFGMISLGSLAAQVIWQEGKPLSKTALGRQKITHKVADISRVSIKITGPSMGTISEEFPFADKQGVISGVPAGADRMLTISGLDTAGIPIFRGMTSIEIFENMTTEVTLYATEVKLETLISPVMAGGFGHSLALKADGNLWAWGLNDVGQLGNGTFNNSSTPVHVSQLTELIGVIDVDSESLHSVALKYDGTVWTWGDNECGQLGNGAAVLCNYSVPSNVPASSPFRIATSLDGSVFNNVSAVQAGTTHTMALKNDGTVWTWGGDAFGQLGYNNITSHVPRPVQVKTGVSTFLTGVKAISAGADHNLALSTDGTVWAWGYNFYGQLGDGSGFYDNSPVAAIVGDAIFNNITVIAIAAGSYHSVALDNHSAVWAWGDNQWGQIGIGIIGGAPEDSPVQVLDESGLPSLTGIKAIAAGDFFTLALKTDGTVLAWGRNDYGQLGDGTLLDKSLPTAVSGLTGVEAIFAGDEHALVMKTDGSIWAWGSNEFGQIGDGSQGDGDYSGIVFGDYTTTPTLVPNLNLKN